MPNWCVNRLVVSGSAAEVEAFVRRASSGEGISAQEALEAAALIVEGVGADEQARIANVLCGDDGPLSFANHAPLPCDGWSHEVAVATWGTKWDATRAELVSLRTADGAGRVEYSFDTAWGPPVGWLAAASGAHPALEMRLLWNEEQGFCGAVDAVGGGVSEQDLEWSELREEWPEAPFGPWDDDEG